MGDKAVKFKIQVKEHTWSDLCYDQALERLKKLIDAGIVYVTGSSQEPDKTVPGQTR